MKPPSERNPFKFIHNQSFVEWVLKPNDDLNKFWEDYRNKNPSQENELERARFLVKGLVKNEKRLKEEEIKALWIKIEQSKGSQYTKFIKLKRWVAAAGILLIIGISGWLISRMNNPKTGQFDYQSIAVNVEPDNEIKLVLANHTQKTFTTREVNLKYKQDGKLEATTGKEIQTEELTKSSEAIQMNQLVVPRGKRSSIELADGTKLWLNSGSRAIYPVAFTGKTREIYIEGEGYLEVAHDLSKPFVVITDHVAVKVLGTKFDISAYKEDEHVSVVRALLVYLALDPGGDLAHPQAHPAE